MVPQSYIFYKIMNGIAPKYLANYLNINDNQVYKRKASEGNNIKDLEQEVKISNNTFFLSVLMNDVN